MKGFVINLDRSKDRLKAFEEQLFTLGFERVSESPLRWRKGGVEIERIPAVDGSLLSAQEVECYYRPFKSNFWDWTTHKLTVSEIGCYLSHFQTWQKIVDEEENVAFVLEDDMILSPDIFVFLETENWIPEDAACVKLDFSPVDKSHKVPVGEPVSKKQGRKIVHSMGRTHGAGCYLLTQKMAREAIRESDALRLPVDLFLFDARYEFAPKHKMYCVFPALALSAGVASTIGDQRYKDPLTLKLHLLKGFYSLVRKCRLRGLMHKYRLHWEEECFRA